VMVWVGWYLGFAPVLLIPVDIVSVWKEESVCGAPCVFHLFSSFFCRPFV
jgi:hypothetical protein